VRHQEIGGCVTGGARHGKDEGGELGSAGAPP
jgi:hypothetical protein